MGWVILFQIISMAFADKNNYLSNSYNSAMSSPTTKTVILLEWGDMFQNKKNYDDIYSSFYVSIQKIKLLPW